MDTKAVMNMAQKYLANSLMLSPQEEEYRQLFSEWLPRTIIDIHTHCNLEKHVGQVPDKTLAMPKSTFLYFNAPNHQMIKALLFPKTLVIQTIFAFPFEGIDLSRVNKYLAKLEQKYSTFIPFCAGRAHEIDKFFADWKKGNFYGIKFYPEDGKPDQSILDVFPESVFEFANINVFPIMMHLPQPLRFCADEVFEISQKYPFAKIILAHAGVEKLYSEELLLAYKKIANCNNVFLDCAMTTKEEIIRPVLEVLGPKRLLFGTDQPISLLRINPVIHPELGLRYKTDFPYHWANPEEQAYYEKLGIPNGIRAIWGMLLAIKGAMEKTSLDTEEIKQDIFYNNSARVLQII